MRRNGSGGRQRRTAVILFAALFFVPIMLALIAMATSSQTEPPHREIVINSSQYEYDPNIIEVNQGDILTIKLRSNDVAHGIYIDGYDINLKLIQSEIAEESHEQMQKDDGGEHEEEVKYVEEAEVTFVADKAGTFRFRCSITCGYFHPFMIGKLVVKPQNEISNEIGNLFGFSLIGMVFVSIISSIYFVRRYEK